jgi:hypothetical protein
MAPFKVLLLAGALTCVVPFTTGIENPAVRSPLSTTHSARTPR